MFRDAALSSQDAKVLKEMDMTVSIEYTLEIKDILNEHESRLK